jgi:hypothetical protein
MNFKKYFNLITEKVYVGDDFGKNFKAALKLVFDLDNKDFYPTSGIITSYKRSELFCETWICFYYKKYHIGLSFGFMQESQNPVKHRDTDGFNDYIEKLANDEIKYPNEFLLSKLIELRDNFDDPKDKTNKYYLKTLRYIEGFQKYLNDNIDIKEARKIVINWLERWYDYFKLTSYEFNTNNPIWFHADIQAIVYNMPDKSDKDPRHLRLFHTDKKMILPRGDLMDLAKRIKTLIDKFDGDNNKEEETPTPPPRIKNPVNGDLVTA